MREIRFRAWDKKRKTMIHGLPRACLKAIEQDHGWTYGQVDDYDGCFMLMQYTGLKDKNGKKIWEGDILGNFPNESYWYSDCEWVVCYYERVAGFRLLPTMHYEKGYIGNGSLGNSKKFRDNCSYEVIGNIYENEDLL